jgi:hypothetical protein
MTNLKTDFTPKLDDLFMARTDAMILKIFSPKMAFLTQNKAK